MAGGKAYIQSYRGLRILYTSPAVALIVSFISIWLILMLLNMEKLAYYFSFMVPANTVVPIPTPPIILYTAMFYSPLAVAITGGIASALGCILDYIIIGRAADRFLRKYRDNRWLIRGRKYFKSNGFLTLLFFAFTPFPFEPVKVLAILSEYNMALYAVAISISRGIRYFILATVGKFLTVTQIIAIAIIFVLAVLLKWGKERWERKPLSWY